MVRRDGEEGWRGGMVRKDVEEDPLHQFKDRGDAEALERLAEDALAGTATPPLAEADEPMPLADDKDGDWWASTGHDRLAEPAPEPETEDGAPPTEECLEAGGWDGE
eukprot:5972796-Pyramimonas_sp.AAC.1